MENPKLSDLCKSQIHCLGKFQHGQYQPGEDTGISKRSAWTLYTVAGGTEQQQDILSPAFSYSDQTLLTNQLSSRKCSFLKIRWYQLTSTHPIMVWFGLVWFSLLCFGSLGVLFWFGCCFFGGIGVFFCHRAPAFQCSVTTDTISRPCSTLFLFWQGEHISDGQELSHYL